MSTVQEEAYAAGLFDGEGWIRVGPDLGCRLSVQMTDEAPIRFMYQLFGGSMIRPREVKRPDKSLTGRTLYCWQLGNPDQALSAINAMQPYSLTKARQLDVAEKYLVGRSVLPREQRVTLAQVANTQITELKAPTPMSITFDIETMGLDAAEKPVISCTYMYNNDESTVFSDDILKWGNEENLLVAIRDRLEIAGFTIGWNSSRFDLNYINTRLARYDQRPMFLGSHDDADVIFDRVYNNKKRTSLVNAVNQLNLTDKEVHKTPIDWNIWDAAYYENDRASMDYIINHAENDVKLTRRVWDVVTA